MPSVNVTKLSHFSGHKDAIYTLCRAADADKVIVKVNRPIYSLCLLKEQGLLYCGAASGNLHVIDLSQGREIRNIEAHSSGIFDIKMIGDILVTAGGDGCINIWDPDTLVLLHHIEVTDKSVRSLSPGYSGKIMAAGSSDHKFRVYSTPGYELLKTVDAHSNSVFTVAFTPHDNEILSGGRDAMLRSWIVGNDYKMDVDIAAHTLHINHIEFNPAGNLFATVSMDKTIKIWETQNMHLLKVIDKQRNDGHLSSVNKALWLGNDQLLTCSDDRAVMHWRIELSM
jgi:WD40 repeat protein